MTLGRKVPNPPPLNRKRPAPPPAPPLGNCNYNFYAVVDSNGIVSVNHEHYHHLKAIFNKLKDAEKVLARNPDASLRIIKCGIVEN